MIPMGKFGRNDPCPCGGGKKYKHCHGSARSVLPVIDSDLLRRAQIEIAKKEAEQRERVVSFGEIRPIISTEAWGERIVGVGNRLYKGDWKYPRNFLDHFLQERFGGDWTNSQNELGPDELHPITRWRTKAFEHLYRQLEGKDPNTSIEPNGFMSAYFGVAYELYVVDDNGTLDDRLLARLKHREQFQGARHELFVEATCLRAGFSVNHEDESDPSRRHVEFIATHKASGLRLAVEAKSRHRAGVVAQPGTPQPEDTADFKFSKLLNDAIAKRPVDPLAIFIDTNLPVARAREFFGERAETPQPSRQLISIIDEARNRNGGTDPYNLLVFTNTPDHYGRDNDLPPHRDWIGYIAQRPAKPVSQDEVLLHLAKTSELSGNIPNTFPA
jgi:hypothetical protein